MIKFKGEKGQFIIGHVEPPLADVKVTVFDSSDRVQPITAMTSDNGGFKWVAVWPVTFSLLEVVVLAFSIVSLHINAVQS